MQCWFCPYALPFAIKIEWMLLCWNIPNFQMLISRPFRNARKYPGPERVKGAKYDFCKFVKFSHFCTYRAYVDVKKVVFGGRNGQNEKKSKFDKNIFAFSFSLFSLLLYFNIFNPKKAGGGQICPHWFFFWKNWTFLNRNKFLEKNFCRPMGVKITPFWVVV